MKTLRLSVCLWGCALVYAGLIGAAPPPPEAITQGISLTAEEPRDAVSAATPPAAPTDLMGVVIASDEVHLTWLDNSSNEQEFRVEYQYSGQAFKDFTFVSANQTGVAIRLSSPAPIAFRVRAHGAGGYSGYSNAVSVVPPPPSGSCGPTGLGMCLNQNRFRILASFRAMDDTTGAAHAVQLTSDSGYLWFFASSNIELVTKVLNGCGLNSHYWVFAGGLTNVEVILSVVDTQSPTSSIYYAFPQGRAFPPLQSVTAFATCP